MPDLWKQEVKFLGIKGAGNAAATIPNGSSQRKSDDHGRFPIGLDKWLVAMWLIVNCKNGISSCEIARRSASLKRLHGLWIIGFAFQCG